MLNTDVIVGPEAQLSCLASILKAASGLHNFLF